MIGSALDLAAGLALLRALVLPAMLLKAGKGPETAVAGSAAVRPLLLEMLLHWGECLRSQIATSKVTALS